jgi:hypothetical protein
MATAMQDYGRGISIMQDPENGIYDMTFLACSIITDDDVRVFFRAIAERLATLPSPRDIIFCLDGVEVAPAARRAYGVERARVAREYYRFTARYAGRSATKVTVMTSGVVHRIEGMVYETRQEAVHAILQMRANAS